MLNGTGKLRLPIDKQHAEFFSHLPGAKRRQVQHGGGVFSAGERDADA